MSRWRRNRSSNPRNRRRRLRSPNLEHNLYPSKLRLLRLPFKMPSPLLPLLDKSVPFPLKSTPRNPLLRIHSLPKLDLPHHQKRSLPSQPFLFPLQLPPPFPFRGPLLPLRKKVTTLSHRIVFSNSSLLRQKKNFRLSPSVNGMIYSGDGCSQLSSRRWIRCNKGWRSESRKGG